MLPRTENDVTSTKVLAEKLSITNFYRQKRQSRKSNERKVSILETVVEKLLSRSSSKMSNSKSSSKRDSKINSKPKMRNDSSSSTTAPKSLASAGFDVIVNNENTTVAYNETTRGGWGMGEVTLTKSKVSLSETAEAINDIMEEIDLDSMDFNAM